MSRAHPLVASARRALPKTPGRAGYLRLLESRLEALDGLRSGRGLSAGERDALAPSPLARRVLRPLEASWNDGDENLVRESLDTWHRRDRPPEADLAGRLLAVADQLAAMELRDQAIVFYLWELESMLHDLSPDPSSG